ncbi:MAG TPA: DUF262 domain-containing protein [Thermoanaerobaculia bacterium]
MHDSMKITRTMYKVSDFLAWQRGGQLDLRPPFQRGSVWSARAKSYFIDTLLRGFAVPIIFLQDETDPRTYAIRRLVVDGQQRLRTVLAYIDPDCLNDADDNDEFTILSIHNSDFSGKRFSQLPPGARQRILGFELSVHVLPPTTSSQVLLETFARMNSTGVKLNEQELRNATYFGAFKQMVYELAYEQLERWLRWRVFSRQQIARMKEAELTSELLLLMKSGIAGRNQLTIDDAYRDMEDEVSFAIEARRRYRAVFETLDELHREQFNALFGEEFNETAFSTQGWFYVLFAMVYQLMFGKSSIETAGARAKQVNTKRLRAHLAERAERLDAGDVDAEVLKALRGASTDKRSRTVRYDFIREGFSAR